MKVIITGGAGFLGLRLAVSAEHAALGLPKDDGLDSIVRDYIADYLA